MGISSSAAQVRADNGYVIDQSNYLSENTENYIEYLNDRELNELEDQPQYMVEVVKKLPANTDIDEFRNAEFERLGVGQKDVDNGLLLVIAVKDRKYGVEVGYGLEGVVTDSSKAFVIDKKVTSLLRSKNYDAAVLRISKRLKHLLVDGLTPAEKRTQWQDEVLLPAIIMGFVGLIVLALFLILFAHIFKKVGYVFKWSRQLRWTAKRIKNEYFSANPATATQHVTYYDPILKKVRTDELAAAMARLALGKKQDTMRLKMVVLDDVVMAASQAAGSRFFLCSNFSIWYLILDSWYARWA